MHHRQKPIRKSSTGNPVTRTLRENPSTFVLPAGWAGCFLLRPWFLYGSNARIANAACALKQHPKTVSTRHETHRSHEVISIFPFCTVPSPTAGRRVFQNTNTSNICTQILSGRLQNRETFLSARLVSTLSNSSTSIFPTSLLIQSPYWRAVQFNRFFAESRRQPASRPFGERLRKETMGLSVHNGLKPPRIPRISPKQLPRFGCHWLK